MQTLRLCHKTMKTYIIGIKTYELSLYDEYSVGIINHYRNLGWHCDVDIWRGYAILRHCQYVYTNDIKQFIKDFNEQSLHEYLYITTYLEMDDDIEHYPSLN